MITIGVICSSCSYRSPETAIRPAPTLAQAIPGQGADAFIPCVAPNANEQVMLGLAAKAMEMDQDHGINPLDIGAQRLLADPIFGHAGSTQDDIVCVPTEILSRVSDVLAKRHGFAGRLVEYQLNLARKLPPGNSYVIDSVGNAAFSNVKQPSELFPGTDIRPYARTVLASFGRAASKFGSIAYKEMSDTTSLGTGAAQVAAATGQPQALAKIATMMEAILSSVPQNRSIPDEKRIRILELSWAIYFAGDAGKAYTKPMHDAMRRKYQSSAPPFGTLELPPYDLCPLLANIESEAAMRRYDFCRDVKVTVKDQSSRP